MKLNAHAMGALHGVLYTNSLEAFNYWYAKGVRDFEVDVNMTSDGEFVLSHDVKRLANQTRKEFLADKMVGIHTGGKFYCCKGTGIDLNGCFEVMLRHPDVKFMFDFQPAVRLGLDAESICLLSRFCREFKDADIRARSLIEVGYLDHVKVCHDGGACNVQLWIGNTDGDFGGATLNDINQHNVKYVSVDPARLSRSFVSELKNIGVTVYSADRDDYRGIRLSEQLDVDYYTTHFPFSWIGSCLGYPCWQVVKNLPRLSSIFSHDMN